MIAPYNPDGKAPDPLLEHAEHAYARGKTTPAELAADLGIDLFRASRLIITLQWRGGQANGVAA